MRNETDLLYIVSTETRRHTDRNRTALRVTFSNHDQWTKEEKNKSMSYLKINKFIENFGVQV